MAWELWKLGTVCSFENGDRGKNYPSKSKFVDSGVPFVNAGHLDNAKIQLSEMNYITEEHFELLSRGKFFNGDILFCLRGSLGKCAIVNDLEQGAIASSLVILRPNEPLNSQFLLYYLQSPLCHQMIQKYKGGAAQPNLGAKDLEKFLVPIPDLSTQKEVVKKLNKAFADIEKARANTEQNLQNARELFDSYLQQVFSECGEGWKKTTLNELCTKFEYGTSSKSSQEGEVPVIRMGNIQDGRIVMDKLVYSLNEEDNQKYHLNFNDVLFNRTNSAELVGKTAIYKSEERAIFAGYLIRIHRNEKLLNADYLNFYLNSPIARKYGEQVMSQSTNQANISGTKLKTYPISIPVSLEEQQSIVDKISTLKEKVEELEATHKSKLTVLDELKQSLLQQAFTGQLTQG
ncbi:TPA: restriction endonuclease subunit S [Vibrio fluvialis]|nr:restriction endonuclease subunit S [Vibrio fluvialis]